MSVDAGSHLEATDPGLRIVYQSPSAGFKKNANIIYSIHNRS